MVVRYLQLGQGQPDAGELLEVHSVLAGSVFGDDAVSLGVGGGEPEVTGLLLDHLLELGALKVTAIVGVRAVEPFAERLLGNLNVANVVLQLLSGEVAVVVVASNVGATHVFLS